MSYQNGKPHCTTPKVILTLSEFNVCIIAATMANNVEELYAQLRFMDSSDPLYSTMLKIHEQNSCALAELERKFDIHVPPKPRKVLL